MIAHNPPVQEESARLQRVQLELKQKEELVTQLQAENLCLKGALRDATGVMRSLVGILQMRNERIPQKAADFLGMSIPIRSGSSLPPCEMEKAYRRTRCN